MSQLRLRMSYWGKDKITDGGGGKEEEDENQIYHTQRSAIWNGAGTSKIQFPVSQHLNTCRDTCRHAPLTHTKIQVSKHVKTHWSNISFNVQQAEKEASECKKAAYHATWTLRSLLSCWQHFKQTLGCIYTKKYNNTPHLSIIINK